MAALVETLIEGVLGRDPRAVSRALSIVENDGPAASALLSALRGREGHARLVGVTGPPGAGKSTLVGTLITAARARHETVAVLAVDPSSPFSGGAVLGDRIRLQQHGTDPGVFIRSMAARGHLGGLAIRTADAVRVLDAAGFDLVFIETVGVGQGEIAVIGIADVVAVVAAPGAGDDVQALKAGVLEIADIFVVNKADTDGADRTVATLERAFAHGRNPSIWRPPVLRTVATMGAGASDVLAAVDRFFVDAAAEVEIRRAGRRAANGGPRSGRATLDHVGIAVADASALYDVLSVIGLRPGAPEDVPAQGARVRFIEAGAAALEMVEAIAADSTVARFLSARGVKASALHHVAVEVEDLVRTLDDLRAFGARLVDDAPRLGAGGARVAFVHPASTSGVLLELVERGGRASR